MTGLAAGGAAGAGSFIDATVVGTTFGSGVVGVDAAGGGALGVVVLGEAGGVAAAVAGGGSVDGGVTSG